MSGFEAVVQRAVDETIPIGVHLDLTHRCDLSCVHCYLSQRRKNELDLGEIDALLAELADLGCLFLLVSGGEPFLREDILDILSSMRRRGFDIRLLTHARHIDQPVAEALGEIGVSRVGVSLYSHESAIHDDITGREGSHEQTIRGIEHLRAAEVNVLIKCLVFERNAGAEQSIPQLAKALGCAVELAPVVRPALDGVRDLADLNLDPEREREVVRCIYEPYGDLAAIGSIALSAVPCLAGHASCHVDPEGIVRPCVDWPVVCGDLRRQCFAEIWHDSPYLRELRSMRRSSFRECASCENLTFCRLCPSLALRETGSATGRAPTTCRLSEAIREVGESDEAGKDEDR